MPNNKSKLPVSIKILGYNQTHNILKILKDGQTIEVTDISPYQYNQIKSGKIDIKNFIKEDEHVGVEYTKMIKKKKDDTNLITPTLYPDEIRSDASNSGPVSESLSFVKLIEKRQVQSVIEKIIQQIYHSKTVKEAKSLFREFLEARKIKPVDKQKMLQKLDYLRSLLDVQQYATNAMLKFEGLGLKESIKHDEDHLLGWFEMMPSPELKIWANFQRKYGNKKTAEKLFQHSETGVSFKRGDLKEFSVSELETFLKHHNLNTIYKRHLMADIE